MSSGLGYTYRLQIDFGHLGDYSHPLADMTAKLEPNWTLTRGFQNPKEYVAPASRFDCKLQNINRELSPEITTSPYYGLLELGTLVKFTASYNGVAYRTWVGKIDDILPYVDPNVKTNSDYVNVVAQDFMPELEKAQIFPALQTDVLISDAITTIMDGVAEQIAFPYESSWAMIDVGVIDTAKIMNSDIFTAASVSSSTLPYFGDNLADAKNTVGALSAIKDLMATENGGRFWWADTEFRFIDRYFAADEALATPALSIDAGDIVSVSYRKGGKLANDISLTYQPRQLGTPATVIYSMERTLALEAQQSTTRQVHYRDPNTPNKNIGATAVLDMVAGVDYIANNAEDGSGTDLSLYVSAKAEIKGQSATITLVNNLTGTVYFTTLQIRGTPILTYERETVKAIGALSIAASRRKPKSLVYKLVSDEATAQGMANVELARYKDPFAEFVTIGYRPADNLKLLQYIPTVGDAINVSEQSATKHSRDYTLIGMVDTCDVNRDHKTTLYTSPIAREQWWILGEPGFSELGSTNIVAL